MIAQFVRVLLLLSAYVKLWIMNAYPPINQEWHILIESSKTLYAIGTSLGYIVW